MTESAKRRRTIRELISRNRVSTQEQLVELLATEGLTVTQATISRDLHELGVRKERDAYVLPPESVADSRERKRALSILRQRVLSVHRSGSMVVLKTEPGLGPTVAVEIEAAGLPHVLGTVAGLDTVFVAAQTATQSRMLMKLIESA